MRLRAEMNRMAANHGVAVRRLMLITALSVLLTALVAVASASATSRHSGRHHAATTARAHQHRHHATATRARRLSASPALALKPATSRAATAARARARAAATARAKARAAATARAKARARAQAAAKTRTKRKPVPPPTTTTTTTPVNTTTPTTTVPATTSTATSAPVTTPTATTPSTTSWGGFGSGSGTSTAPTGSTSGSTTTGTSTTTATSTTTSTTGTTSTGTTTTGTTTGTSGATGTPASANSIYWGAVIGPQFNGNTSPWDMSVVSDFETQDAAGKGMSIIPMYQPFTDCSTTPCTPESFPWTPFNNIRAAGAIPMISWSSQTLQDGYSSAATDPTYTLANVAAGDFDTYITAWAQKAKQWGQPFFLRFDWEMNGNWFPWGQNTNSNTPAQFVAAWRHVHDIFTQVGATNATWVWCPNTGYDANLASLYPGDAYVDWTCLDGYNWGTSDSHSWQTWDQVAQADYTMITQQIAVSKPMMIGEFNSSTLGGSRATWLTTMLNELPVSYPDIHAIVLFDDDPLFTLETDPASVSAFSAAINAPAYTKNSYGNLTTSPIPIP